MAAANPINGVAVCADPACGRPLKLVCEHGHEHDGGPLTIAPLGTGRANPRKGQPRGTYTLKPKPCARCAREFQPTGPRSLYCQRPDCSPLSPS